MKYSKDGTIYETLQESLSFYMVNELRSLLSLIPGSGPKPNKKDDLIQHLISHALKPSLLSLLTDLERCALAETVHVTNGIFDRSKFAAKYGNSPFVKSGYGNKNSIVYLYLNQKTISQEMQKFLQKHIAPPEANAIASSDSLPSEIVLRKEHYNGSTEIRVSLKERRTEHSALSNLEIMLRLVEKGRIRVGPATGIPGDATVKMIAEHLADGDWYPSPSYDGIQAYAWPMLLSTAGLTSANGGQLSLSKKGRDVLSQKMTRPDAIKMIWNSWKSATGIDEFNRISVIKGQKSRGRVMTSPKARKDAIVKALSLCPHDKWIQIDEFGRFMRAEGMHFDVAHNEWELYICEKKYGSLGYEGCNGWNILQERYIKVLFLEYMAALGIVDIGFCRPEESLCDFHDMWGTDDLEFLSRYDGLQLFRITPLGEYVLGHKQVYTPEHDVTITNKMLCVLPNFQIIATDQNMLNKADRLHLDQIAQAETDSQWKLTTESLRRALENGETAESILQFLESRSTYDIPVTVRTLLQDSAQRMVEISFEGRACLLRCNNESVLQHIRHDPKLCDLAIVNNSHIIIHIGKEREFFKRLNALGYAVPSANTII